MTLPGGLTDLRGLRAARWTRESTAGQRDRFGPAAQADRQDDAIATYGLVDTGLAWSVAHSGRTIATTSQWAEMIAAAGERWDVLVVGYVSRFARDLRTAVNARHDLHNAGAVILFADERVLSSDEQEWERWAREAVEAESYSRRLSRRVREAFAAKRRIEHDYGSGETSFGFRRVGGLLEPDPETMPRAIDAYRMAAAGATDREIAAALGIGLWPVRTILRSPLYAGLLPDGSSTRFAPPVHRELVDAAAAHRARRNTSGHQPARHRTYPLTDRGPLVCAACARPFVGVYRNDRGQRLYRHPAACDARPTEVPAEILERQVGAILAAAAPNARTIPLLRAALAVPVTTPDRMAILRIDAEMRRLALSLVDRADPVAVRRLDELRAARADVAASSIELAPADPDEAIDYLADLGRLWAETSDEGRRALAVATFARLGTSDRRIVDVEATPAAERRGLALALPTMVSGVGGTGLHQRPLTWSLRVAHRRDWLRAARSA